MFARWAHHKLHVARVAETTAVSAVLTEGHRHDGAPFAEVYAQATETGEVRRVIADKAYDWNPIRNLLAGAGVKTTIPWSQNERVKARWPRRHSLRKSRLLFSRLCPPSLRFRSRAAFR